MPAIELSEIEMETKQGGTGQMESMPRITVDSYDEDDGYVETEGMVKKQ